MATLSAKNKGNLGQQI